MLYRWRKVDFGLDISFNLDVEQPTVSLQYKPLTGEPFLIQNTVPLSLQISWKIHQTLVRPRFKDLFDLMHLVQHPSFDKKTLDNALQALINECSVDRVDLIKLKHFLNYEIEKLYPGNSIEETWNVFRHNSDIINYNRDVYYERGHFSIEVSTLPIKLADFLAQFKMHLQDAGVGIHLFENLPKPTRVSRKTFENNSTVPTIQAETNTAKGPKAENKQNNNETIIGFFARLFK